MTMLLISEVFPPQTGGSGRWFWEVYRRLPREDVLVAAGEHPRARTFDAAGTLACERLPLAMQEWGLRSLGGMRRYARLTWRLRGMVRREGIQAIHAARCLPEGWLAWMLRRLTGTPYLVYVHGEDVRAAGTSREHTWMVRQVFRDAALVVANSQNTARILLEDWGLGSIAAGAPHPAGPVRRTRRTSGGTAGATVHVLYPGVDTERFRPTARHEAVRRRLGWDNRRVVLTVGRLQRRKGHDMLVRALESVRRHAPDVLYAIVGDGAERPPLEALVRQEGLERHVQMLGELDEDTLVKCYQQCDLFALPNRELDGDIEGFGMVLLEAQACGKPVLAGDSGGTRETMVGVRNAEGGVRNAEDGATGWIVDCTAPAPLAEVVSQLLLDGQLRERMGHAAREWAVERFSWPRLAKQATGLFEMVDRQCARARVHERLRVTAEQVGT